MDTPRPSPRTNRTRRIPLTADAGALPVGAHAAARARPASGGALRPRGWLRWRGARDPWGEGRRGKAGSKPQHEAWHVPPLPSVAPAASLAAGARWDSDPPPPPSRTKWTRLVHPSVLFGHVSSTMTIVNRLPTEWLMSQRGYNRAASLQPRRAVTPVSAAQTTAAPPLSAARVTARGPSQAAPLRRAGRSPKATRTPAAAVRLRSLTHDRVLVDVMGAVLEVRRMTKFF